MREHITHTFGTLLEPLKAFVIYRETQKNHVYVEAFDMDQQGRPINAHPLSVQESIALAKALDTAEHMRSTFLEPSGLMPRNVLYINRSRNAYVVWQTPPQRVRMLFKEGLSIPNGEAWMPPLIWRASRGSLSVFALNSEEPLTEDITLCAAPFFNVYRDGKVCLGSIDIRLPKTADSKNLWNCGRPISLTAFSRIPSQAVPSKGTSFNCGKSWSAHQPRSPWIN